MIWKLSAVVKLWWADGGYWVQHGALKCACQGGARGKNQSLVAAVRGEKFQVLGTV